MTNLKKVSGKRLEAEISKKKRRRIAQAVAKAKRGRMRGHSG